MDKDEYHRVYYVNNFGNHWAEDEDMLRVVFHDRVWLDWDSWLCGASDYELEVFFIRHNRQVILTELPEDLIKEDV